MHRINRPIRAFALATLLLLILSPCAFAGDQETAFEYEESFTVTFHDENDGEWTFGNSYDQHPAHRRQPARLSEQ